MTISQGFRRCEIQVTQIALKHLGVHVGLHLVLHVFVKSAIVVIQVWVHQGSIDECDLPALTVLIEKDGS